VLIDNPTLMDRYARGIYSLYQRWSDHALNQRRTVIESLLTQIASSANLPMPRIVWMAAGSSWFRIGEWEIHASLLAVRATTTGPIAPWPRKPTRSQCRRKSNAESSRSSPRWTTTST
jgi:hypothetical protein